jgi:hypothetical protein
MKYAHSFKYKSMRNDEREIIRDQRSKRINNQSNLPEDSNKRPFDLRRICQC